MYGPRDRWTNLNLANGNQMAILLEALQMWPWLRRDIPAQAATLFPPGSLARTEGGIQQVHSYPVCRCKDEPDLASRQLRQRPLSVSTDVRVGN